MTLKVKFSHKGDEGNNKKKEKRIFQQTQKEHTGRKSHINRNLGLIFQFCPGVISQSSPAQTATRCRGGRTQEMQTESSSQGWNPPCSALWWPQPSTPTNTTGGNAHLLHLPEKEESQALCYMSSATALVTSCLNTAIMQHLPLSSALS